MAQYSVARLEEIDEITDGRCPFRPVRQHLDIRTFGINAMTAHAAGNRIINEHDEDESEPDSGEELYFVAAGHATFELDGVTEDAPAGTFVRVLPGVKRTAFARDADTTVLAIGAGKPGKPYEASGWELFVPLFPLFESEAWEEGADRAQALLEAHPEAGAGVYYNTACFESRAGRREPALAHLRHAIERAPSYVDLARKDEDFGNLRDVPEFQAIIAQ